MATEAARLSTRLPRSPRWGPPRRAGAGALIHLGRGRRRHRHPHKSIGWLMTAGAGGGLGSDR